jgi:ATP-binding cassette subfamily B protein
MKGPPPGQEKDAGPGAPPSGMQGPPEGLGPGAGPPLLRSRMAETGYFFRYLRPVRGLVVVIVVSSLVGVVLRLPFAFLPKRLADHFSPEHSGAASGDTRELIVYLVLALLALIAAAGLMLARGYSASLVGEHLLRSIRQDLFSKLERLGMLSIYARGAGQFVQRLARDVYYIRDLFNETLTELITGVLQVSVLLVVLLWLEPVLTIVLLAVFLLIAPFVKWVNHQVERLARRTQELGEEILAQLVEAIGGFRDIVAAGRFDRFARRFDGVLQETERTSVRTALWGQFGGTLPSIVISILLAVPYFVFLAGDFTIADVGLVITYVGLLAQVLPVFSMMAHATSALALATPSLREVRSILDDSGGAPPPPDAAFGGPPALQHAHASVGMAPKVVGEKPPQRTKLDLPVRSIRFEGVGLELGGRPVVSDLNFEIPGGKFTAIVGQSGAGKTTIFHLLLRLIVPSCGSITINGRPLTGIDDGQLRQLIGFIPQNPFIFNQSIRENLEIAVAERPSAEALSRAIELAQLRELVEGRAREGGLEAGAGYMGMRLSGGEKQRVALARLLLQDPQVIVGDEYTANIDVKTARLIHEAMRTHFAGRTRIVITHELYTVKGADHIIVLDHGRVVQSGPHDELLSRPGLYRELWQTQTLS